MWSEFCDVFDNPERLTKSIEAQVTLDFSFYEDEEDDK